MPQVLQAGAKAPILRRLLPHSGSIKQKDQEVSNQGGENNNQVEEVTMDQEARAKDLKALWNEFCTKARRRGKKNLLYLNKVYIDSSAIKGVRTFDLWEQNPNTGSDWAKKALGGMSIIWIFNEHNRYVGRLVNGQTYTNLLYKPHITINLP
jgi:hypothetical protein